MCYDPTLTPGPLTFKSHGDFCPLIPIHVLPIHTCEGPGEGHPYRYNSAAAATDACLAAGCDGLAQLSMLNSPLYAYNGINADNGTSTADSQLCAAAWYRNDLGLGGGGEFITAYHMQVDIGPGCGPPGYNIWSTSPRVDAAAGCVGCPRQLQTCP